ncbi:MAG: cobalamin-binding protein [Deltaproteobacteria bacterium]|jgi:dimethylamine corrinoid protein|nr:cobalamin-binding protein [Deltaproteobacteria bacterium]
MSNPTMDLLVTALLDGDQAQAITATRNLCDAGVGHAQIILDGVETAMVQLDAKCTVEAFNLLEIMLAGRAVMGVMKELYPPGTRSPQTKGTVVLASLEGDIHDLGKNVLKMILIAKGYRVVDCGKDCPVEKLIDVSGQEGPLAIGVSGLLTSVIPQVRRLREKMTERRLGNISIMAGGATLKQASAESLNVDFVAETAFDGVSHLEYIAGGGNE